MLPAERITRRAATAGSAVIGDDENAQAIGQGLGGGCGKFKRPRRAWRGHFWDEFHARRNDSGSLLRAPATMAGSVSLRETGADACGRAIAAGANVATHRRE